MKRRHVRITLEGEPGPVYRSAERLGRSPSAVPSHERALAQLEQRVELVVAELARVSHAVGQLLEPSPTDGPDQGDDPGPFFDVLGGSHRTRDGARAVNDRVAADADARPAGDES